MADLVIIEWKEEAHQRLCHASARPCRSGKKKGSGPGKIVPGPLGEATPPPSPLPEAGRGSPNALFLPSPPRGGGWGWGPGSAHRAVDGDGHGLRLRAAQT